MGRNQLKRAHRSAVGSDFECFMTWSAVQNVLIAAFKSYFADLALALIERKDAFRVETLLVIEGE